MGEGKHTVPCESHGRFARGGLASRSDLLCAHPERPPHSLAWPPGLHERTPGCRARGAPLPRKADGSRKPPAPPLARRTTALLSPVASWTPTEGAETDRPYF